MLIALAADQTEQTVLRQAVIFGADLAQAVEATRPPRRAKEVATSGRVEDIIVQGAFRRYESVLTSAIKVAAPAKQAQVRITELPIFLIDPPEVVALLRRLELETGAVNTASPFPFTSDVQARLFGGEFRSRRRRALPLRPLKAPSVGQAAGSITLDCPAILIRGEFAVERAAIRLHREQTASADPATGPRTELVIAKDVVPEVDPPCDFDAGLRGQLFTSSRASTARRTTRPGRRAVGVKTGDPRLEAAVRGFTLILKRVLYAGPIWPAAGPGYADGIHAGNIASPRDSTEFDTPGGG
jgi:hypothetical protein